MDEDIEKGTGCFPNNNKLPCARFIIASAISLTAFSVGITMTIMSPVNSPMLPFWTSLITGAISYWVQPPSMNDKK